MRGLSLNRRAAHNGEEALDFDDFMEKDALKVKKQTTARAAAQRHCLR
jgi:hypothetical protein